MRRLFLAHFNWGKMVLSFNCFSHLASGNLLQVGVIFFDTEGTREPLIVTRLQP